MRHKKIRNIIALLFAAIYLTLVGCGNNDSGVDIEPIGITIKSPRFNEIESMYTDVDVSLKFTDSSGSVTECNVFIGTDLKVKGTCGDISLGAYSYELEYKYQGIYIAKSIGMMTFDENNTEIPITLLDKSMDEDKDGYTNLQEFLKGTDPTDPTSHPTAPTKPGNLSATPVGFTQIDLTWDASTDDNGVSGYNIYRDGTKTGISATISYSDKGLTAGTQYCYQVSAYDGDEEESDKSDQVCAMTEEDEGLVAFYPFNGNANDESGNGNNGTVFGATLTEDRFGNTDSAYSFDGDWIEVPDNSLLQPNTAISVAVWVNPQGFYSGKCEGNTIIQKGIDSSIGYYALDYSDGGYASVCDGQFLPDNETFAFHMRFSDGTIKQVRSEKIISINQWYFVVGSYDGTSMKIYINGVLESLSNISNTLGKNNNQLTIGRMLHDEYPYWINGSIDNIRIYNRALSEVEIQALYNEADPV